MCCCLGRAGPMAAATAAQANYKGGQVLADAGAAAAAGEAGHGLHFFYTSSQVQQSQSKPNTQAASYTRVASSICTVPPTCRCDDTSVRPASRSRAATSWFHTQPLAVAATAWAVRSCVRVGVWGCGGVWRGVWGGSRALALDQRPCCASQDKKNQCWHGSVAAVPANPSRSHRHNILFRRHGIKCSVPWKCASPGSQKNWTTTKVDTYK